MANITLQNSILSLDSKVGLLVHQVISMLGSPAGYLASSACPRNYPGMQKTPGFSHPLLGTGGVSEIPPKEGAHAQLFMLWNAGSLRELCKHNPAVIRLKVQGSCFGLFTEHRLPKMEAFLSGWLSWNCSSWKYSTQNPVWGHRKSCSFWLHRAVIRENRFQQPKALHFLVIVKNDIPFGVQEPGPPEITNGTEACSITVVRGLILLYDLQLETTTLRATKTCNPKWLAPTLMQLCFLDTRIQHLKAPLQR